jgi:hypothetical protein
MHRQTKIPVRGQIAYRAYLRGLSVTRLDAPPMREHWKTAEECHEGRHKQAAEKLFGAWR